MQWRRKSIVLNIYSNGVLLYSFLSLNNKLLELLLLSSFKLKNKNLFFNAFLWKEVKVIIWVIPKDNNTLILSSEEIDWLLLLQFTNIFLLLLLFAALIFESPLLFPFKEFFILLLIGFPLGIFELFKLEW